MARAPLLHLQSAACARSTPGTVHAMVDHLALEVAEGSYVAEALVGDLLERSRADLGLLLGVDVDGIALTGGATAGLLTLLETWPLPQGAEVGVVPGEWAPNLDAFTHHGLRLRGLAVDDHGVLDLDAFMSTLRDDPPGLVHLTHLASHRGLVQPVAEAQALCRHADVPLWVDVASPSATSKPQPASTRRTPPRGSGWPARAASGCWPWPDGGAATSARTAPPSRSPAARPAAGAGGVAGRRPASGSPRPARARRRRPRPGPGRTRRARPNPAWPLVRGTGLGARRPGGATGALVRLRPTAGQDVATVRDRLLDEHRILATACLPWRAPAEMDRPLLRVARTWTSPTPSWSGRRRTPDAS